MNDIAILQKLIDESRRVVFFGGAGVSTESGIPDFRSVDGLYSQTYRYPPETILSHDFFTKHTAAFYEFYRAKMLCLDAQPNAAHKSLAALEAAGKLTAVITQNIDGLHQQAGSKAVYELHGSVHRNTCLHCGKHYNAHFMLETSGVPTCSCGGTIKPNVVLYGEGLDSDTVEGAVRALSAADLLIVGGTSLAVYPAAGLIAYCHGRVAVINRSPTPLDTNATLLLQANIGEVFARIVVP